MHFIYILHSQKLDKFYIGETHDVDTRLQRHNSDYYESKWSKKGQPWTLFTYYPCKNRSLAIKIEQHINRMKSKQYIKNLVKHPQIFEKLHHKYNC